MNWENIAANIEEFGKPAAEISAAAGLGKNYIWNMNAEEHPNPTLDSVRRLAKALECDPSHLLRERTIRVDPPKKNKRKEIAALRNLGTPIPDVFRLWSDYQGKLVPGFVTGMQNLGMWERSQLYAHEDGLYIYGWMGQANLGTLGMWALEAPGNVVGENDPDICFVKFTKWIWDRVMDRDIPRRYAVWVRNAYNPAVPGLSWDGFYAPLQVRDKRGLLVVCQTMKFPKSA